MCGRYSLKILPDEISSTFDIAEENLPVIRYGRFNIAPSQEVLVLRLSSETGEREMITMRWGLVPSWAKEGQGTAGFINARAEPERRLLLRPLAAELLDSIPVSTIVNNPAYDGAECVREMQT